MTTESERGMAGKNAAAAPSDTPEMDSVVAFVRGGGSPDRIEFRGRQLERDRNRLREEVAEIRADYDHQREDALAQTMRADALQSRLDAAGEGLPPLPPELSHVRNLIKFSCTHETPTFIIRLMVSYIDSSRATATAIIAKQAQRIEELERQLEYIDNWMHQQP